MKFLAWSVAIVAAFLAFMFVPWSKIFDLNTVNMGIFYSEDAVSGEVWELGITEIDGDSTYFLVMCNWPENAYGFVLTDETTVVWKDGLSSSVIIDDKDAIWNVLSYASTVSVVPGDVLDKSLLDESLLDESLLETSLVEAYWLEDIDEQEVSWYYVSAICINTDCDDTDEEDGMDAAAKPVIYLYPTEPTQVTVQLAFNGLLTCTYPAYERGWTVIAEPDGTLTDADGLQYNYLYWEGETTVDYDFSTGFCVAGEDTAAFLEDALAQLGLNRREANEFIVYWLPLMQDNPYNLISFQGAAYTDNAVLTVNPQPDTEIRVFMVWTALEEACEIPAQDLSAPEREGFVLVEWGGAQVENP